MKRFIITLIAFIMLLPSVVITAEEANVNYNGNAGEFVFDEDGEISLDNLFPNFRSVMPGDKLSQIVNVKNDADDKVKVKLYIRLELAQSSEQSELLEKLNLNVSVVGVNPMFESLAIGAEGIDEWTEIGVLYSGGDVDLLFTLEVPEDLDNEYSNQSIIVKWQFMAFEMPVNEADWECPVCHKNHYRIDDSGEYAVYVCDNCDHTEDMICEICGKRMKKISVVGSDGKEYFYYECIEESEHHTDPTPKTGDDGKTVVWFIIMCISILLILFVIFGMRKKKAGCRNDT